MLVDHTCHSEFFPFVERSQLPTVLAYYPNEEKYSLMNDAFTPPQIKAFLADVVLNRLTKVEIPQGKVEFKDRDCFDFRHKKKKYRKKFDL